MMRDLTYYYRRLRALLWHAPEPVVRTVLALWALSFLIYFVAVFFARSANPLEWLIFASPGPEWQIWRFFSYPLVVLNPLNLLIGGYWFWIVGGTLERSWGSRTFRWLLVTITVVTSVSVWAGSLLLTVLGSPPGPIILAGLWLPLAALTVAWCQLNPDQVVLLGFVLPIPGRILMWLTVGLTYLLFVTGHGSPWLGFFGLAGIATAYAYTRQKTQWVFTRARKPTPFENMLDWLDHYWREFRRRGPWR